MRYPDISELLTARLRLRRLTREDIPLYYARLGSSEAVTRYMLFAPHQDISESKASIEKALRRYEEGRCYRWCIARKEDDSLIGVIELLRFDEEAGTCSFAYMLAEEFWGKGYGTEAVTAVLGYAFEKMDMDSVEVDHMTANPASGAVMRKAGMTFVWTIPCAYVKNGEAYDAAQYRMTRAEWFSSKS